MSANIIDGKLQAAALRGRIKTQCAEFVKRTGITPSLAVILAGEDPASQVYVRNKIKACGDCGIKSHSFTLPRDVTKEQLFELVDTLNENADIHGILVQLPLPGGIDEESVLSRIAVQKDVDGFSLINSGKIMRGDSSALLPCTPAGCIQLIKSTGIDISGKHAVIVGRSNIVGKPLSLMLLAENATVTVCHSRTQNLSAHTRQADILCAAVGIAGFITGDMVKAGAVVIDVGINRIEGRLAGDVDYTGAKRVARHITPVPGGVGPMTIAMLLNNTLKAAKLQCNS